MFDVHMLCVKEVIESVVSTWIMNIKSKELKLLD